MRGLLVALGLLLAVPACTVSRFGISATPSRGWHVRIDPGALRATTAGLSLVLFEDPPDSSGIYRHGSPAPFVRSSFGPPDEYAKSPNGHGFARRNFTVSGRYFSLFVQARTLHPGRAVLRELNVFVRSLRITRGDFFPGRAPPARFRPVAGWHSVHSPTLPVSPSTYSIVAASTVPYRDCLDCFPPRATLSRLGRAGIVIVLDLTADDRSPPASAAASRRGHPPFDVARLQCGAFEGDVSNFPACELHGVVLGQYDLDGWIVFGQSHPSAAQKRRAQAELDRLVLPRWPRWR